MLTLALGAYSYGCTGAKREFERASAGTSAGTAGASALNRQPSTTVAAGVNQGAAINANSDEVITACKVALVESVTADHRWHPPQENCPHTRCVALNKIDKPLAPIGPRPMTRNKALEELDAMTPEQEQHLASIKSRFCAGVDDKYRRGQQEHGGRESDVAERDGHRPRVRQTAQARSCTNSPSWVRLRHSTIETTSP